MYAESCSAFQKDRGLFIDAFKHFQIQEEIQWSFAVNLLTMKQLPMGILGAPIGVASWAHACYDPGREFYRHAESDMFTVLD